MPGFKACMPVRKPKLQRDRLSRKGFAYHTVLGPSSRAGCPAPGAFGVVEFNGRSASPGSRRGPPPASRYLALLADQWDTHQPIFSASSTMIPAGPRT